MASSTMHYGELSTTLAILVFDAYLLLLRIPYEDCSKFYKWHDKL